MLADYIDTVTIGDCLKVMSNIEDNSVDVCFADPPLISRKSTRLIKTTNQVSNIWIGAEVGSTSWHE